MSGTAAASPHRLRLWATVAALGGFLFGYHAGVLAGALLPLRRDFGLTSVEQGVLVGLLPLGAMAGSLLNHRLADTLGRRRTLIVDALVFLVGTVISAAAPDYAVLLVGRALVGLGVGSTSSTVPLYISELAPAGLRGRLVTVNQVMVTLGIVGAYLVDLAFAASGSWRAMLAVGLVPAALLLVGMLRAPESPVWLAARAQQEERRADRRRAPLWTRARTPLLVGVGLGAIQQLSGINAIVYYAPSIMERTGLNASRSILYSVIVGAVNAVATLAALRLVDRLGRRPLLLGSLTGCFASLVLLGLTFTLPHGFSGSWLSLLCLLAYIVAFAVGLGPLFWVLVAEIFPADARATGAGAATSVNWFANFLVGLLFLPLVGAVGQGATFFVFAAVCAAGVVFVSRYVPETAGRSFDEIEADLRERGGREPGRASVATVHLPRR
jgi:MFS family permease